MSQDQNPKSWDPARFTHGHIHGLGDEAFEPDAFKQHTVIILNNPLENKTLLFDVCMEGMHRIKARDSGPVAHITHQLVALYVLMAEQIDSTICISLERKKAHVFVILVTSTYYIVDHCFSSLRPFAEIWTPYVPTWRSTIEAKT